MNIIKKWCFLWKAWRNTLSIEEFSFLLELADDSWTFRNNCKDALFAQKLLKWLFKDDLSSEKANMLVHSNNTVIDLWLKAVEKSHKNLTETEKQMLVRKMPWHSFRRFPVKLDNYYLEVLFAEGNPLKIKAYCRNFALPPEFERLLVSHYADRNKHQGPKMIYHYFGKELNGWEMALDAYLSSTFDDGRLENNSVQKAIMEINDAVLLKKLVQRCNMHHNILSRDVLVHLINSQNEELLRIMLTRSYMPEDQVLRIALRGISNQMSSLLDISDCRKELLKLEEQKQFVIGAIGVLPPELNLELKMIETPKEYMAEYEELYIKPLLQRAISPALGASIAYYFPHLSDEICKAVYRYANDYSQASLAFFRI